MARLARPNLPPAEVQRVRQGIFYRNGELTKSVPTRGAWVGRCVVCLTVGTGDYKGFPECLGYVCRARGLRA